MTECWVDRQVLALMCGGRRSADAASASEAPHMFRCQQARPREEPVGRWAGSDQVATLS